MECFHKKLYLNLMTMIISIIRVSIKIVCILVLTTNLLVAQKQDISIKYQIIEGFFVETYNKKYIKQKYKRQDKTNNDSFYPIDYVKPRISFQLSINQKEKNKLIEIDSIYMIFPYPSRSYIKQIEDYPNITFDTLSVEEINIPTSNVFYKNKKNPKNIYKLTYAKVHCISFLTTAENMDFFLPLFKGDKKLSNDKLYHLFYIYRVDNFDEGNLIKSDIYKIWKPRLNQHN